MADSGGEAPSWITANRIISMVKRYSRSTGSSPDTTLDSRVARQKPRAVLDPEEFRVKGIVLELTLLASWFGLGLSILVYRVPRLPTLT